MADDDALLSDGLVDAIAGRLAMPGELDRVAAGLIEHAAQGNVPAVNALVAAFTEIRRREHERASSERGPDLPSRLLYLMESLVPLDSGKVAGALVARGVTLRPPLPPGQTTALSRLVSRLAHLGISPGDALGWRWGKDGLAQEVPTGHFREVEPGGAREWVGGGGDPPGVLDARLALRPLWRIHRASKQPSRARRS